MAINLEQEFVTVIPKVRTPNGMGDLRNISCTMLPSKIFESFVLNWLSTEVRCKGNRYGDVKGCGVSHLLADLWGEVLNNLEDARAATMITAIDYAKAFNRLSFQHCLEAFARKGASSETIRLLATFLSNRTMTVRVNNTWSDPLPVYGGVPQGSILGVLLFNVSTDDLEDEDVDAWCLVHSSPERASLDRSSSPSTADTSNGMSSTHSRSYDDAVLLGDSSSSSSGTPDGHLSSSSSGVSHDPVIPSLDPQARAFRPGA